MTDAIIEQLIQGGAMGLFAAFLIWQHIGMQKRLDGLVERFQTQLDKINDDYDERIDKMRERYDIVIDGIRAEAQEQAKDWADIRGRIMDKVVAQLDKTSGKIDLMVEEIRRNK